MTDHTAEQQVRRGDRFRFRGKRIIWQVKNVDPDGVELCRADGRPAPTRWLCWREIGWELIDVGHQDRRDGAHCRQHDETKRG